MSFLIPHLMKPPASAERVTSVFDFFASAGSDSDWIIADMCKMYLFIYSAPRSPAALDLMAVAGDLRRATDRALSESKAKQELVNGKQTNQD